MTELGYFPGAQTPDRQRTVDVGGLRLAVHEWGDADAPPFFFVHGGFDFASTYNNLAPMIAAAGSHVNA
jgi:pimeloyl-ACP methyl ester carboxylesterase